MTVARRRVRGAGGSPRTATQEAAHGQPPAAHEAETGDHRHRVLTAARLESAANSEASHRDGKVGLVEVDDSERHGR